MRRPFVLLSVATSLDGHIDDATPERLILSNGEDLDRVDAERAAADAILVGTATIAADDPRLLVRSAARRADRVARGLPPSPTKVTITRTGRGLDPRAQFFTAGDGLKLVYAAGSAAAEAPEPAAVPAATSTAAVPAATSTAATSTAAGSVLAAADLERRLAGLATVVAAPDLPAVLADLAERGVSRLMVEGGTRTTTAFLTAGLVDELQVVVAPLVVGDPAAPRLAAAPVSRMELADVRRVGDCALLVYRLR